MSKPLSKPQLNLPNPNISSNNKIQKNSIPPQPQRNQYSNKLQSEILEQEKELELIKQAYSNNNFKILDNLAGIPKNQTKKVKGLTEEEKQKRDEQRRLKDVEKLDQIQQRLFRQCNKKKIQPIKTKAIKESEKRDGFLQNIEKDYDKLFREKDKNNKVFKYNTDEKKLPVKLNNTSRPESKKINITFPHFGGKL